MRREQKNVREYKYIKHGQEVGVSVEYNLVFEEGKLSKVYNEFHHSINEDSECFLYFKNKFACGNSGKRKVQKKKHWKNTKH